MSKQVDFRKIDPEINYTLEQASEFLNLSYTSILKLKKQGTFDDIKKIGRRYYISGQSILDYVKKVN